MNIFTVFTNCGDAFISYGGIAILIILGIYLKWGGKSTPKQMLMCPLCHTETNYLTTAGHCQECDWAAIAERRLKASDDCGGCS